MNSKSHIAIILAAGKGSRMQSSRDKVLHLIAGLPLLGHAIRNCEAAGVSHIVIVTAPNQEKVREFALSFGSHIRVVIQEKALGTGNAVSSALSEIDGYDKVLICFGDTPLMRSEVLSSLAASDSDVAVTGFISDLPYGYGRIVLDNDNPIRVIEEKDCDDTTRAINLCNGGTLCVKASVLPSLLNQLDNNNAQKEYLLPDVIEYAHNLGYKIRLIESVYEDSLGVDTQIGLAKAEKLMQDRLRHKHLVAGVSMISPETVFFSYDTQIGNDVLIEPNCFFGLRVSIEDNVVIKGFSHIEGAFIGKSCQIGPYARLRPETYLGEKVKIGNFVETKKANIEANVKISHLTYMGDVEIGEHTNIGAGVISCNYDGYNKYKTKIGKGVFIGSNATLIAPLSIEDGAFLAASSVIRKDVAKNNLVRNIIPIKVDENWVKKTHIKNQKEEE